MMKQHLMTAAKLLVSFGLLYWLFFKLGDPAQLQQRIATANFGLLALGLLCYTAAVALGGIKWGILLRAVDIPVPMWRLLHYQWVAEFFNNFLPAQVGGDVMRGYALATDTRRAADAAASVLIDRFIGLLVFMLAAAGAAGTMLLIGKPDGSYFQGQELLFMQFAAVGSGGITILLAGVIAALLSRTLKRWMEYLLGKLPFSQISLPIWQKLAVAFHAYRSQPQALLWTAVGSALIVILTSINIWLIARAIQPGSISMIEVLAVNPLIVFALFALPLTPGGLGIRQTVFASLFLFIGAGFDLGKTVGLLQQAIGYLVSIPGGILWLVGRRKRLQAEEPVTRPLTAVEPPTV
ncbi:MAG: flippase-like domain-containing protein [Caldilineaceae bacterium]|nr:flippase-like domain-containing protein [Caldilineaceae bacterium]